MGKKVRLAIKVHLILIGIFILFFMTFFVVDYFTDNLIYMIPVTLISSFILMIVSEKFINRLTTAHSAKFRKVEPLSSYDSLQDRAQKFLELKIPAKSKKLKRSFVHKLIESYAKTGEIELTEKERTKLTLVIMDTGISSQEPGKKNYYERERVAILENILNEKINN